MNKIWIRLGIVVASLIGMLLAVTYIRACSFMPAQIWIKCGTGDYSKTLIGYNQLQHGLSDQDIENVYTKLVADYPECASYIPSLRNIFKEYYNTSSTGKYPVQGVFEPYSVTREAELQKRQDDLTACWYEEYSRFGDWFVTTVAYRNYCEHQYCFTFTLSLRQFFLFLLENPNTKTLPYLMGYVLCTVICVGLCFVFLRSRLERIVKLWTFRIVGFISFCYAGFLYLGLDYLLPNPFSDTVYKELLLWFWICFAVAVILSLVLNVYKNRHLLSTSTK